ncbi:hypothetical protein Pmani_004151 [Petrolisthes manimaculis]|uniref:Protein kinase domain-containing protein n=1 Tax=Petrolisthes manimaculis TaxID=1843537 RepID=A0AAE1QH30_9EUCA|nr:hypothetical protein Pmani_004151 [Petrolisthes manimaculis]
MNDDHRDLSQALERVYKYLLKILKKWKVDLLPNAVVTKAKTEDPAIVTTYAGTPLHILLKNKSVHKDNVLPVVTQIVEVIRRLTEASLCHCDLKADNIVVEFIGQSQRPKVTIIDLGLMRKFGDKVCMKPKKRRSVYIYAPELCDTKPVPVSPESQVYQVGRVMSSVLEYLHASNQTLTNISRECLREEPKSRPRIEKVFRTCKRVLKNNTLSATQTRGGGEGVGGRGGGGEGVYCSN